MQDIALRNDPYAFIVEHKISSENLIDMLKWIYKNFGKDEDVKRWWVEGDNAFF